MPRAAANEAQQAQGTASANAAQYGQQAQGELGPLNTQAQSLINSQGYDPATLGAITNAGMGGVNSAFGSAAGQVNRNAARSGNEAGTAGQLDTLAQQKGNAGGQEAGNIQIQNANFQNQQRMAGLNVLNSLYGTNTNAQLGQQGNQTSNINAQTTASPGWAQTLGGVLSAVGGTTAAAVTKCWIAARLYGGWDDPRVSDIRHYLFVEWPSRSIVGRIVSRIYLRFGERASKSSVIVTLLKPLFDLALRRSRDGR